MPGNYNLGTAKGTIEVDASSLGRAQASLRSMGLGLLGIGAAALTGFGYAVKQAADFEQIMSQAQSALGATDAQMQIVKKTALELGANSVYGAKNVAKAIEQLAFAGLSIEEITGGAAKATIDLAQASGGLIGLDVAGRTVVNTMRTFGLGTRDAVHIADELAGAANRSTIDIEDMVTSLRYVGPVAHSAGVGLDDISTALAILGDRGIRGSTAGTSLRGVFVGLISPSEKAATVMKNLGIITADGANIMFDASGKMKSLGEVAQILQDHTRGLTQEQKLAAFSQIFQRRAMASALVLSEQGKAGFDKYAKSIAQGGSAAHIAAVRLNNLKGDVSLFRSQLETTVIKAGTPFQEMLRNIVQNATSLVKAFGDLSPTLQSAIMWFLLIAGTLFTVAGAAALAASSMLKMYKVFKDLKAALELLIPVIQYIWTLLVGNPIGLIVLAIAALIAIVILTWIYWDRIWNFIIHHKALTAVIALITPMIAILMAIVLAIRYVWENWDTIWPQIQSVFSTVVGFIMSAWDAVASFFVNTWDTIAGAFTDAWNTIQPIIDAIGGFFDDAGSAIADFVREVGHQLTLFGAYFDKNVMPTVRAFGELMSAIWERLVQGAQAVWSVIHPILNLLIIYFRMWGQVAIVWVRMIITTLQFFVQWIIATFQLLAGILRAIWEPLWQAILLIIEGVLTTIQGIISVFVGVIGAIWGPFWNGVKQVVQTVWSFVKEYIDAAMQFIKGIIQIITGLIKGDWGKVWQGIKAILAGVWDAMVAIVRFQFDILKAVVTNGINAVVNFFKSVPGRVASALGNLLNVLKSKGTDLMRGLWNGIQDFWSSIQSFFIQLPGSIIRLLGDLGGLLVEAGKHIMNGLLDGIKEGLNGVKDFVTGIPSKVVSWKGPPDDDKKMLVENGQFIMQGLVAGMDKGMAPLQRFLEDVTALVGGMSPNLAQSFGVTAAAGAPAAPLGDTYYVNFTFGDVLDPDAAQTIKNELNSPDVLTQITLSMRAGRRG